MFEVLNLNLNLVVVVLCVCGVVCRCRNSIIVAVVVVVDALIAIAIVNRGMVIHGLKEHVHGTGLKELVYGAKELIIGGGGLGLDLDLGRWGVLALGDCGFKI